MKYENYHRHSHWSNVRISDSPVTQEDYAKRTVELGHRTLCSVEHYWCGNVFDTIKLAKKYNLKPIIGAEVGWVKDRSSKDRARHMVIIARNENGRQALNDILSEANLTGFFYQPRVDMELLLTLPPEDVIVTTACVAYWEGYEDISDVTKRLAAHFKYFFLEVQCHDTEPQRQVNKYILKLHTELNIPIIFGSDSHYIYPEQSEMRDAFLNSKGLRYDSEDGWYMDFPDGETVYKRFAAQCILSHEQILDAIANTNVLAELVEEYDTPIFSSDIKMPSLYPDWTQKQKDDEYRRLVYDAWNVYKESIPKEQHALYEKEISNEIQIVLDMNMSDYFILDHQVIKRGKELGGRLTKTGRGSGVSFITNMLLGFTDVDRLSCPVHLYSERFLSTARAQLPDIDFNCADVTPFAKAQEEILGADHAKPMLAYGTYQKSSAWKLYAKSQGIEFELANAISDQIKKYENAVKHASEDDRDSINIKDYIAKEYWDIYEKSSEYLGLVTSWSISPCAYVLTNLNIRKQFGLSKIKDSIVANIDGKWAEECNFLKNDLLVVKSVDTIYRVYERIGKEPPSVKELIAQCTPENKCWDIYKKGATLFINQCEQEGTRVRVQKYAPRNVSELAAFIAAIRPGFKSQYKKFEARESFSFGVKAFDELIKTTEFPQSYMLYQEQAMRAMAFAGIPIGECYSVIKDIAKKRVDKVLAVREKFLDGFTNAIINEGKAEDTAREISEQLWQVIEDSAYYSFNACVSGETVICKPGYPNRKFTPTVKEMFDIFNNKEYAVKTGHKHLRNKYRTSGYGNALSMFPDNRVRSNKIVDIRQAGIRDIYRVTTHTGEYLDCTLNHKFPTPQGEMRLEDLKVGEQLYAMGAYEKNTKKYSFTDGYYKPNYPRQGECGYCKGIPTKIVEIKSIEFLKTDMTYDIEMMKPAHTFISLSGLVTSNSHAVSMAADSLYMAWLKSHYPIEFYETCMKICEEKGDKDRITALKDEAESYFNIEFPPYRFGQDNRSIKADKSNNQITNTLTAIKGFNQKIGKILFECYNKNFTTFIEVLEYLCSNGIKESKVRPLILIDYFRDIGTSKNLEKILDAWEFLKEGCAKSIKKESVRDETLAQILASSCTSKNKDGSESNCFKITGNAFEILREYEKVILSNNDEYSIKERMRHSFEVLGYVDLTTNKEEDRRRLLITDLAKLQDKNGNVWAYRAGTRSVGTGKTARLTIRGNTFDSSPFEVGDIVYAETLYKNQQGYWYLTVYEKEVDYD